MVFTAGAYTAPVTGYYEITCYLHTQEEDATFFINVNGFKITGKVELWSPHVNIKDLGWGVQTICPGARYDDMMTSYFTS